MDFEYALAQLRHLYHQISTEQEGLRRILSGAIAHLEKVYSPRQVKDGELFMDDVIGLALTCNETIRRSVALDEKREDDLYKELVVVLEKFFGCPGYRNHN